MAHRTTPAFLIAVLLTAASSYAQPDRRAGADPLAGPPFLTSPAWAVADGRTGNVLGSGDAAKARPMASTTKVMTALIVLTAAEADPAILDQIVTVSARAADTPGSSAKIAAGEKVPVGELLYGLLLPSGNDAAVALAEHVGPRFGDASGGDGLARFVAEMNRRAKTLGLRATSYDDPNGLSRGNVSSARDLAALTYAAMRNERFRTYVQTRRHESRITSPNGEKRPVTWGNTNRLLGTAGYDGVKTGTTTPAGHCLVATGTRGDDRLIVVVLGSTSADGRYADARNLFRWGWRELGHAPDKK